MRCPHCHSPRSAVVNSRPQPGRIMRRRQCVACRTRWTTYELPKSRLKARATT